VVPRIVGVDAGAVELLQPINPPMATTSRNIDVP
jgi:hypothetical protein